MHATLTGSPLCSRSFGGWLQQVLHSSPVQAAGNGICKGNSLKLREWCQKRERMEREEGEGGERGWRERSRRVQREIGG